MSLERNRFNSTGQTQGGLLFDVCFLLVAFFIGLAFFLINASIRLVFF